MKISRVAFESSFYLSPLMQTACFSFGANKTLSEFSSSMLEIFFSIVSHLITRVLTLSDSQSLALGIKVLEWLTCEDTKNTRTKVDSICASSTIINFTPFKWNTTGQISWNKCDSCWELVLQVGVCMMRISFNLKSHKHSHKNNENSMYKNHKQSIDDKVQNWWLWYYTLISN